jgi:D-3-phosphoglycerate dehydrogenase / 2-oxoglutarate reductase
MAKVLIAEPLADPGVDLLRTAHEVDARASMTREELLAAIADVDALVVRSATKVDAEVLEAGRDLKVVGRAGIGLDNVDVAAATRLGIMVVNAPQSNVISAAEHTVALILAQARNIPQAHAALREGRWERTRFQGAELYGKTLGIVGLGRVGALVAQRCNAFGMRLLAYDPFVSRERAAQMGVELASLAEVLGRADIVTVHLPKTPETTGLIGEAELYAMKRGARLVNTARGGIVDEAALAKAVGDGQLAGAALDVFAEEPATHSPLFDLDSVVVTPHLGASTAEAQDKAGITIAQQLLLALDGQFVPNAVNVDAGPVPDALRPFLPLVEKLGQLYTALAGQFVPNAVNVDAGPVPDALRPFLPLVEKLGQLYTALAGGGPGGRTSAVGGGRLQIDYVGALVDQDIRVLTLAALKGMLGPVCHEPVTFVNAPLLAAERGIEVTESKTRHSRDWVNLITLSGEGSRGPVGVAGTTVGPRDNERLVAINGIQVDMAPAQHMAFLFYEDRPGVIGRVGTLLGESGVNIGSMQVGRRKQGGEALMALTVDAGIPAGVLDRVEREIGAYEATFVQLAQTGAGA